ncbi:hypothetical protein [Marinifilum caeruleilacunae]|uniref:Uncharacterized protein n=1 Tax=Marinifilum caeruleilacunae TaxID=2499076 RepID=A0ABX1WWQ0_9BACT|nr:hypothetical protein [Marinifilum caeruleilacunae]NOU60553.1 hypothetical protein [Marinifilum caeruleilacunae]
MRYLLILLIFTCTVISGKSQEYQSTPADLSQLFNSEAVLHINLKGDIRTLFNDRKEPEYHPIVFSYQENDEWHKVNIRVKTRGHFRRMKENCLTPPLLLNFDSLPDISSSLFEGQNKLKLVTTCVDERFVIREYLAYKIYQLITPYSFRVRLVKVSFDDTERNRTTPAKYGILLEDHNKMASRNNAIIRKQLKLSPETTDREFFLKMAVFQYLIGNTDWSIQYLHNIKILVRNGTSLVAVPYDFDMSGIVNTPYAAPAEALQLSSVRSRRYRGYCIEDMSEFQSTFDLFNELKNDIYAIYENNPLIDQNYRKNTIKYLDRFYDIINDKKRSKKEFQYPCKSGGTGNVVIQGLKDHSIENKKNSD